MSQGSGYRGWQPGWPLSNSLNSQGRHPHPPLYLDANCQPRTEWYLGNYVLNAVPSYDDTMMEVRRAAYIEQVQCANHITRQLLNNLPPDTITIIISDHGPDSHGQLNLHPDLWTEVENFERFSVLAAIRTPTDCAATIPPDLSLVNTYRLVLPCITNTHLPLLPNHHYITPAAARPGELRAIDLFQMLKRP